MIFKYINTFVNIESPTGYVNINGGNLILFSGWAVSDKRIEKILLINIV
jgi:hypothetical protein